MNFVFLYSSDNFLKLVDEKFDFGSSFEYTCIFIVIIVIIATIWSYFYYEVIAFFSCDGNSLHQKVHLLNLIPPTIYTKLSLETQTSILWLDHIQECCKKSQLW